MNEELLERNNVGRLGVLSSSGERPCCIYTTIQRDLARALTKEHSNEIMPFVSQMLLIL